MSVVQHGKDHPEAVFFIHDDDLKTKDAETITQEYIDWVARVHIYQNGKT